LLNASDRRFVMHRGAPRRVMRSARGLLRDDAEGLAG